MSSVGGSFLTKTHRGPTTQLKYISKPTKDDPTTLINTIGKCIILKTFSEKRLIFALFLYFKVNKQDFLQVFQGSGIGKKEDKLTSAELLAILYN